MTKQKGLYQFLPQNQEEAEFGPQLGEASFVIRRADTLDFCDEDIQAIFKASDGSIATCFTFEPLLAQLIKELRLLRELLQREECNEADLVRVS